MLTPRTEIPLALHRSMVFLGGGGNSNTASTLSCSLSTSFWPGVHSTFNASKCLQENMSPSQNQQDTKSR
eukprot:2688528-Rhodomonas_salina.1